MAVTKSQLAEAYPLQRATEPTAAKRGRVAGYLADDPGLTDLYGKIRAHLYPLITSNYDVTRVCHLKCEGCLFFEGPDYETHPDDKSLQDYDRFFAREAARGVNFPYFVGAEPALVQERLRIAGRHFKRGIIFTNGTIKIDRQIPFAVHVSLWGDKENTGRLRGSSVFDKSLRNYLGDPRATFIYTLNHLNIATTPQVVSICHGHGVKISFSHFSATERYLEKLADGTNNDNQFFRFSNEHENLRLTAYDLCVARELLDRLIDQYPDTVVYSKTYNEWISRPEGLYKIDPQSGWAVDCETRNADYQLHFYTDLSQSTGKCCAPNIDCSECRAYAMSYGTFRHRIRDYLKTKEDFAKWLEVVDSWCRMFIVGWDELPLQREAG